MEKDLFALFLKKFTPSNDLIKPTEEMLEFYSDKLPKELLDFWTEYGFGNYANGLIKVIEPSDYMDSFYTWIGGHDFTKLPILVTAFGDIFYYRQLSETENDICILNIHHRKIDVCAYSFEEFFEEFILDDEITEEVLKEKLFANAVLKKGNLEFEQIFFFVPALILGGTEGEESIDIGDASTHQELLFRMGN